jgi:hypothetical protein
MNATQTSKTTLTLTSIARASAERTIELARQAQIASMIAETLASGGRK